ncbi:hypothetical protein SAMN02745244_01075 [Tessaracoccus bendigoensis DSM 12906]|uniref:Uncharacterized protein n=1 Tax=Tessaracoccus bendigoensis DSM 12906 TaxID=1123357 RepID=A0A1M6E228_9ACTN|nr:hypothetical protein [Tessaracoccus bendigoensis]SHI79443.1 hypothetical protein SAMN02745244_01075 [Tessaracoccus bendigoensis DSM 12906]
MRRMPRTLLGTLVASAVLVITGALTLALNAQPSASFGWYSYAPLTEAPLPLNGTILLTPASALGASLTVLGLIGFGVAAGFRLGRGRQ